MNVSKRTNGADAEREKKSQKTLELSSPGLGRVGPCLVRLASLSSPVRRQANYKQPV